MTAALKKQQEFEASSTEPQGNDAVSELDPLFAQAVQQVFDLRERGINLNVKVKNKPYDALVEMAEQLREFGMSNNVAQAFVDVLETQATQLGADFTRKEKPTPMEATISVVDKMPELDQSKTHFMVAFDGKKKYGAEYSTVQNHLAGQGSNWTKSVTTNVPAMEKMFTGGGEQYLIFHFEKLVGDGVGGLDSVGQSQQLPEAEVNSVAIIEAAGPGARAADLAPVRQSMESGKMSPAESAVINSVAQLNRTVETIARAPEQPKQPQSIVKSVREQVTQKLEAMTQAGQLPKPAVLNAVITSSQRAEVTVAPQKPVIAPAAIKPAVSVSNAAPVLKADNNNAISAAPVKPGVPAAKVAEVVAPVVATPIAPVAAKTESPVVLQTAAASLVVPVAKIVEASPVMAAPSIPATPKMEAPVAAAPVVVAPAAVIADAPAVVQPIQAEPVSVVPVTPQPQVTAAAPVAPVVAVPQLQAPAPVEIQASMPESARAPVVEIKAVEAPVIVAAAVAQPAHIEIQTPSVETLVVQEQVIDDVEIESPATSAPAEIAASTPKTASFVSTSPAPVTASPSSSFSQPQAETQLITPQVADAAQAKPEEIEVDAPATTMNIATPKPAVPKTGGLLGSGVSSFGSGTTSSYGVEASAPSVFESPVIESRNNDAPEMTKTQVVEQTKTAQIQAAQAAIVSTAASLGVSTTALNISAAEIVTAPQTTKQTLQQIAQKPAIQQMMESQIVIEREEREADLRKERDKFLQAQEREVEEKKAKEEKAKIEALTRANSTYQPLTQTVQAVEAPRQKSSAEADYEKFFKRDEIKAGGEKLTSSFNKACSGNCAACPGCNVGGQSQAPAPRV